MKILLIRSAPLEQCDRIIKELTRGADEHDVTVLTNVATTGDIIEKHSVRIFNYDARTIHLFSIGIDNIRKLRGMAFDKVIIACRNHLGDGYGQIKIVALSVGARDIELWNVSGERIKVTGVHFIFSALLWRIYMVFHGLVWGSLLLRDVVNFVGGKLKAGRDSQL